MLLNDIFQEVQPQLPVKYKEATDKELIEKVWKLKKYFGKDLFIPGHHYQRDDVIQFADATGDSLQLAQVSAANTEASYIIFCGVHFMAETADILANENQRVILPDLRAGCSMADMANRAQTEKAWEKLTSIYGDTIIPITYVNSSAEIKAFVGRHGGATVTSSNAEKMLHWAFSQKKRILFLPDQHLGRNTAYDMGISLNEMVVWNPHKEEMEEDVLDPKMILWKGHCSVHENFRIDHVWSLREKDPERKILVHPECSWEVTQAADLAGSTRFIIEQVRQAPKGAKWAIGTEMNLVKRLIKQFPDQSIVSLNPEMCPCLTMNRIDLPHLVWALDELYEGRIPNQIRVDHQVAQEAKLAIDRMLVND
ncbi:quinolinate synthase [Salipaludibacillus neizhouensis]|uniref:Quinolinate synthase n=1 Tax=Salipaludibacillus neizhouensis TaxID=885475 RepID=A0A3A9KL10_9BACI|nr:quinolinate synthase NadA [Salipaludibacillus neizhouensis]RKL68505.1 quinolinate synthase [Salipaludibacillus neizhouensis]